MNPQTLPLELLAMRSMKLALQPPLQIAPHIAESVRQLEDRLASLQSDLATLENRLDQTRGEYRRVWRHLHEVKAQIALPSSTPPNIGTEDMDLDSHSDEDWEHLIQQITSL